MQQSKPGQAAGFTVVELVLVIVILGIMTAVAVPGMFNQSTFDDHYFVNDVVHGARYARQFAVTKGCYTQLVITTSGFELWRDNDCSSAAFSFTSRILRPFEAENYEASGAPTGTVADTVTFDTAGRAGDVSGVTFTPFSSPLTLTLGSVTATVYGESGFVQQ